MIKGKMGDASPIRKAFVTFRTVPVIHPLVVMAFERKVDPSIYNATVMKYDTSFSLVASSLPKGVFNLDKVFYETGEITAKTGVSDKTEQYASIGDFADSLDCGEPDYLDSEYWLKAIAGMFWDGFFLENIPFMSQAELERMFLVGDNYAEAQESLQHSFLIASEQGKLESMILDIMSEFHCKFIEYAKEKGLVARGEERLTASGFPLVKVHSMLPFEIASHAAVGSIYSALLPVILASGVQIDLDKLFSKRIERGRAFLAEFIGEEFKDDAFQEVFSEALHARTGEFQPLMPDDLVEALHDKSNCNGMAALLNKLVWSKEVIPVDCALIF